MCEVELIYCLDDKTWDTVIVKVEQQGFENDDPEKELAIMIFNEDIAPTLNQNVAYVGVYNISYPTDIDEDDEDDEDDDDEENDPDTCPECGSDDFEVKMMQDPEIPTCLYEAQVCNDCGQEVIL